MGRFVLLVAPHMFDMFHQCMFTVTHWIGFCTFFVQEPIGVWHSVKAVDPRRSRPPLDSMQADLFPT